MTTRVLLSASLVMALLPVTAAAARPAGAPCEPRGPLSLEEPVAPREAVRLGLPDARASVLQSLAACRDAACPELGAWALLAAHLALEAGEAEAASILLEEAEKDGTLPARLLEERSHLLTRATPATGDAGSAQLAAVPDRDADVSDDEAGPSGAEEGDGDRTTSAEAAVESPRARGDRAWLEAMELLERDENERSAETLEHLARNLPDHPRAPRARYLAAWIRLQGSERDAATRGFEAILQRWPRSGLADDALWYLGIIDLLEDRPEAAHERFRVLYGRAPGSARAPALLYWQARALQLAGDLEPERLEQRLRRIVALYPGSYYAQLARGRLAELGLDPGRTLPTAPEARANVPGTDSTGTDSTGADAHEAGARRTSASGAPRIPRALDGVRVLANAGLWDAAAREAIDATAGLSGTRSALDAIAALETLGLPARAFRLAARHLWSLAYGRRDPEALEHLYPLPYELLVIASAREAGVSPALIWSLMRRESRFVSDARSHAGALGLMQFMPATATATAEAACLPPPDRAELMKPAVAIRLAAHHLAELTGRFHHPALVAAAYNAGSAPVVGWLARHHDLPLDLFVELIPYKETRTYVKEILAARQLYGERLAGRGPASAAPFRWELPQLTVGLPVRPTTKPTLGLDPPGLPRPLPPPPRSAPADPR